jgi:flagellar hook-length control protein FliK
MISIASLLSTTAPGAQRAPAAVQGATGDFAMALAEVGAAVPMLPTPDPILIDSPAAAETSIAPTFVTPPRPTGVVADGVPTSSALQGLAASGTSLPLRGDAPDVAAEAKPADVAPRMAAHPTEAARSAATGPKATASQVLVAVAVLEDLAPSVEGEPASAEAPESKVPAQLPVDVPRFRQPKCPPKRAGAEPQPNPKRMPAAPEDSEGREIAPSIVTPSDDGKPSIAQDPLAAASVEPERIIVAQDLPIAAPATMLPVPNAIPEHRVEGERRDEELPLFVAEGDLPARSSHRTNLASSLTAETTPSAEVPATTQSPSVATSEAPKLVASEAPNSPVMPQRAPEVVSSQTVEPTRARSATEVSATPQLRDFAAIRTRPTVMAPPRSVRTVERLTPEARHSASPIVAAPGQTVVAPADAQGLRSGLQAAQTGASLVQPTAAAPTTAATTPPPGAQMPTVARELAAPRADTEGRKQVGPQPPEQIGRGVPAADATPAATPVSLQPQIVQPGTVQPAAQAFARAMFTAERDVRPRAQVSELAAQPLQAVLGDSAVAPTQSVQATATRDLPLDTRRDEWMGAMIERIEVLRDEGSREARVRLAPEGLGAIDVSIRHDGDAVQVTLSADRDSSRALLAEAAPKLAELADARGLKLGGATVDGSTAGQRDGRDGRQPQPALPARPASADTADESAETSDETRIA